MTKASELGCTSGEKARGTNDDQLATIANAIYVAGLVAANAILGAQMVRMAMDEFDIADRYYDIADHWMSHYNNWFVPVEDKEAAELNTLETPTPYYEAARGRARVIAWTQFKDSTRRAFKCTSRYCTGLRQDMLVSMITAQANALAVADGLGYRNERSYCQLRDDHNFSKKMAVINHGRNMIGNALNFGASAANIYGDMFSQSWQGLQGINQYLGYFLNRNDTMYSGMGMTGNRGVRNPDVDVFDESGYLYTQMGATPLSPPDYSYARNVSTIQSRNLP